MEIYVDKTLKYNTMAIGLWVKSGSFNDDKEGMHHLLEHLIFNIPEIKHNVEDMKREGIVVNAFTSHEIMCFYVICLPLHMKKVKSFFEQLLERKHIEDEILDFQLEKEIVKKEILYHNNYIEKLKEQLINQMFPKTENNFRILGTEESINNITKQDVCHLYNQIFKENNAFITFAGALSGDIVIENKNSIMERKSLPIYFKKPLLGKVHYQESISENMQDAFYGMAFFFEQDERWYAQIWQQYIQDKLYIELREKRGDAYKIDTISINVSYGTIIMFMFKSLLKSKNDIIQILKKVLKEPIDMNVLKEYAKKLEIKSEIKKDNVKSKMLEQGYKEFLPYLDEHFDIQSVSSKVEKENRYYIRTITA